MSKSTYVGVECPHCGKLSIVITFSPYTQGDPTIPYGTQTYLSAEDITINCKCELTDDECENLVDKVECI